LPDGWRVVEGVNLAGEGRLPPMAGLVAAKGLARMA
jgi:alpha-glucosidase